MKRHVLRLVSSSGSAKERKLVRYTLTGPGDLDKILVRFQAPRDVENTALLTWEAKNGNDDQWLYLPSIKKPKRIAAAVRRTASLARISPSSTDCPTAARRSWPSWSRARSSARWRW